jgi:redox-sensitive bicupin YhaK (pirin superfamily)
MEVKMSLRPIKRLIKAKPTLEGAGVHLRRAFGFGSTSEFDPFLLLDDFRNERPEDYLAGFPWHPHRGIETVTYVLAGTVEHGDSLGNHGAIAAGDVQWMTAGSGIIHQEMPKGDREGAMQGFQLWANLPRVNKMMEPRYRGVPSGQIPQVQNESGATVKIIAGSVGGITGPVHDVVTSPEYLDVTVSAGGSFKHATPRGHTIFAYVIGGKGAFSDQRGSHEGASGQLVGDRHLVLFGDGDVVSISAEAEPVRFLLISGRPIREPVAWHGPIVMNTEDELRLAFDELERDAFIKHRSPH